MPSEATTEIPKRPAADERKYETVREVYEALYRGDIGSKVAADHMFRLNRQDSFPATAARALGEMIGRR